MFRQVFPPTELSVTPVIARQLCLRMRWARLPPRHHDLFPWRTRARQRECRTSGRARCCLPIAWEHATWTGSLYNEIQSASRPVRFRNHSPACTWDRSRGGRMILWRAGRTIPAGRTPIECDDPTHGGGHRNGQEPDDTNHETDPAAGSGGCLIPQSGKQAPQPQNNRNHHRQQEGCRHSPGEKPSREFRQRRFRHTSFPHTYSLSRQTAADNPGPDERSLIWPLQPYGAAGETRNLHCRRVMLSQSSKSVV